MKAIPATALARLPTVSRDEWRSEVTQNSIKVSIRDALEGDWEAARKVTLSAYEEYAKRMPPAFWEGYRKNIMD